MQEHSCFDFAKAILCILLKPNSDRNIGPRLKKAETMAQAPSLADNLGEHLECAVCLEQYKEPKVLPCLHTFCKRCLQGLLTHTREGLAWKIKCPTCRLIAEVSNRYLKIKIIYILIRIREHFVQTPKFHYNTQVSNYTKKLFV